MAIFNPNVGQTSDPNYWRYSHPISNVDADKTLAASIKGVTDIFETGIKGQDVFESERAKATARRDVTDIQQEYISDLTKTAQATVAPGTATSAPGAAGARAEAGVTASGDVIPQPQADLPPGVQQDLADIREQGGILTTARANGKISTTHYRTRLNELAKSYRAANPGYAEFYDKAIEEITGVKPANALIQSLIGDLNAAAAASGKQTDKLNAYFLSHMKEVPEGDLWYQRWLSGQATTQETLNHYYTFMEYKSRLDRIDANLRTRNLQRKDLEDNDERRATDSVNMHVNHAYRLAATGIKGQSGQNIQNMIDGWISGALPTPSDAEVAPYIAALESRYGQTRSAIISELAKPRTDEFGKPMPSVLATLGKKAYEMVDRQMEASFGHTIQLLKSKDIGFAFNNMRMNQHMMADTTKQVYNDKDLGEIIRIQKVISDAGPGALTELLRTYLTSNLKPTLPERMDNFVQRNIMRAGVPSTGGTDKPSSTDDADAIIQRFGRNSAGTGIVSNVEGVAGALMNPNLDKRDPGFRKEFATYLFGPKSRDFLTRISTDYVNVNGRLMPGKYQVYEMLGSRAMSENIKAMNDPAISLMYKNWMEHTFGNILMRGEIHDLADLHLPQNIKVYYDDTQKRFGFMVNGIPVVPESMNDMQKALGARMVPEALRRPMGTLTRLNWGLKNLAGMAETMGDPSEVDRYLVGKLMDFGYDPRRSPSENIQFPGQLGEAVYGPRRRALMEEGQRRLRERQLRGAPLEPGFGR